MSASLGNSICKVTNRSKIPIPKLPSRRDPQARENFVVRTSTVELQGRLKGDALLCGRRLGVSLFSSIERVDVGLVVFLVVKLHDLTRNERLESVVRVRKVWEGVLAGHLCDNRLCLQVMGVFDDGG